MVATWKALVTYQAIVSRWKHYKGCLIGDSISSELSNSLGESSNSFVVGGRGSSSRMPEHESLMSHQNSCRTANIAIETNDAMDSMDGSIQRVGQIDSLIREVAHQERIPVLAATIQPLFTGKSLQSDFTVDGIHLNEAAKANDRRALRQLLDADAGS